MSYKVNISQKNGKTFKLETEDEILVGKVIGEKLQGKELSADLDGYELIITGAGDNSGFPHKSDVEGPELRRVLLTKGWGMHAKKSGLRRKKTVRGKQISDKTSQINVIIEKEGAKKLEEVFPDQNKPKVEETKEGEAPKAEEKSGEGTPVEATEENVAEEIAEEVREEIKPMIPKSPETKSEEKKEEAAEKVAEEVKEEIKEVAEDIAEKEESVEEEKKEN
jgi:small subunit ribosomal protein S6e